MVKDSPGMPGLRRSRASLDAIARLAVGPNHVEVGVFDVSMTGVRLGLPESMPLEVGQTVLLTIEARGRRVPAVPAHVVRVGESDLALAFGPLGMGAEQELGWIIERFGELYEGSAG